MAKKRNEEYIGDDEDGEFEEEPVESFEDPPDFVDEISDEGEPRNQKKMWIKICVKSLRTKQFNDCVMYIKF